MIGASADSRSSNNSSRSSNVRNGRSRARRRDRHRSNSVAGRTERRPEGLSFRSAPMDKDVRSGPRRMRRNKIRAAPHRRGLVAHRRCRAARRLSSASRRSLIRGVIPVSAGRSRRSSLRPQRRHRRGRWRRNLSLWHRVTIHVSHRGRWRRNRSHWRHATIRASRHGRSRRSLSHWHRAMIRGVQRTVRSRRAKATSASVRFVPVPVATLAAKDRSVSMT